MFTSIKREIAGEPMANKQTDEELYSHWQGRIKAALKFRDKCITEEEFKNYSNYYKGRFTKEKKKTDQVQVNKVYSTTTLMTGALVFKDPWIAFKARKDEYKNKENVCEESLNNTMADIGFKEPLEDTVVNTQLFGYGVGKCGEVFDAEETPVKPIETKKKGKEPATGEQPEPSVQIKEESVYFDMIESKRILFDPTVIHGLKGKFIIEILIQPKQYLEDKYKLDLSGLSVGIPAFLKDKFEELDKETQKVFDMSVFYEIWDIVKKQRLIMIEGYNKKVISNGWPKALTDIKTGKVEYPYDVLMFNRAPGEPYGVSYVSLYRTQKE